ncbi:MAG: hypothetical protein ABGZ17_01375, partial [Planctomycetaceae bacterium]
MGSSLFFTRHRLYGLAMTVVVGLFGCSPLLQPAKWWKPRQLSRTPSSPMAPATLMNQIQSTEQPIASAVPDRMLPQSMPVGDNRALRQVGHSARQNSGRPKPSETAERLDVLDGKLNQILIDLTRLEESFRARPDPVFATRETRQGLAALERKLDGVLIQLRGTRPSPAHVGSLSTNRHPRMEQKTEGLLFGPLSQAAAARVPQRLSESNGASLTHLHAI